LAAFLSIAHTIILYNILHSNVCDYLYKASHYNGHGAQWRLRYNTVFNINIKAIYVLKTFAVLDEK